MQISNVNYQGRALGPQSWRGNFFNVKKVVYSEAGFLLSCQAISSHGGRVSSVQKCKALLQSFQKSMEGFLKGRHGLGAISLNVSRYA